MARKPAQYGPPEEFGPEHRIGRWDRYVFIRAPFDIWDEKTRTHHMEERSLLVPRGYKYIASDYNNEIKDILNGGSGFGLKHFPYNKMPGVNVTDLSYEEASLLMDNLNSGSLTLKEIGRKENKFRMVREPNKVRTSYRATPASRYGVIFFKS